LKSVLKVRPLHHRLERRVEAHLRVCVLAYLLQQYLEGNVRSLGLTGAGAIERFQTLTLDELELADTGPTRLAVTELTIEQRGIPKAAGIDVELFHRGWTRLDGEGRRSPNFQGVLLPRPADGVGHPIRVEPGTETNHR
jgi:hypothetical protein